MHCVHIHHSWTTQDQPTSQTAHKLPAALSLKKKRGSLPRPERIGIINTLAQGHCQGH